MDKFRRMFPSVTEEEIWKEEKDLDLPNPTGLSSSTWLSIFLDTWGLDYLKKLIDFLNSNNLTATKIGYDRINYPVVYCWEERK